MIVQPFGLVISVVMLEIFWCCEAFPMRLVPLVGLRTPDDERSTGPVIEQDMGRQYARANPVPAIRVVVVAGVQVKIDTGVWIVVIIALV